MRDGWDEGGDRAPRPHRTYVKVAAGLVAVALTIALIALFSHRRPVVPKSVLMTRDPALLEDAIFIGAAKRGLTNPEAMPTDCCYLLLLDPAGSVTWNGTRAYTFQLSARAGELESVEVWKEAERQLAIHPEQLKAATLRFDIEVPLLGVHTYSVRIATRQGAMRPLQIRLFGTIYLDNGRPDWLDF